MCIRTRPWPGMRTEVRSTPPRRPPSVPRAPLTPTALRSLSLSLTSTLMTDVGLGGLLATPPPPSLRSLCLVLDHNRIGDRQGWVEGSVGDGSDGLGEFWRRGSA